MKEYHCIVCGKRTKGYHRYEVPRCQSCAAKQRTQNPKRNSNYKHGNNRKPYVYNCIERNCNNKTYEGNTRCKKCAYKTKFPTPESHPNWQGGISKRPYARNFTVELREEIRKRDNYLCQNCGMIEEEHLSVFGRILYIHHIDYNKLNSNIKNLITLCCPCNMRANYNREFWKEHYGNIRDTRSCQTNSKSIIKNTQSY